MSGEAHYALQLVVPTFAIVIATRNRREQALRALRSALVQVQQCEVILVDNGSSDGTADAVADAGACVLVEPRPGASRARNLGLGRSSEDYVAFLDDDGVAPVDWIAVASGIVEGSGFDALGGPYQPLYDAPKPAWFKDSYETRTWGPVARELGPGEVLSGSNMIWKRETLLEIGGFDVTLGPAGSRFACGEDTELFFRLRRLKPDAKVWYDPALAIRHSVTAAKMKPRSALKRGYDEGRGWIVANPPANRWTAVRELARRAVILIALGLYSAVWPRWIWARGPWCFETGKKLTCQWGNVVELVAGLKAHGRPKRDGPERCAPQGEEPH